MGGFRTLLYKETLRFWKVSFQTVAGPVLSALLYLVIFAQAMGGQVRVFDGVPYTSFLIPGLGQMYRGDVATGFGWLIATLIGYVLLIVPGLVLHIWCIVSAARPSPPRQPGAGRTAGVALGG